MPIHSLKCRCGKVTGQMQAKAAKMGTRIICYCEDCQAFLKFLGTDDKYLDEYNGTDIFQVPVSHLEITVGEEHIRCLRLTEKGMFRWYTNCCKTPIGNTFSAKWPFIGLIHSFMSAQDKRDTILGPVYAHVNRKALTKSLPSERDQTGSLIIVLLKILGWKLKGLGKPNPFFDDKGNPITKPKIIRKDTHNERS